MRALVLRWGFQYTEDDHGQMHLRPALVLVLFIVAQLAANAQDQDTRQAKTMPEVNVAAKPEVLDLNMYSRIRDEGFKHSHVMEYASALFDDIGPRLSGSPAMARASRSSSLNTAARTWRMASAAAPRLYHLSQPLTRALNSPTNDSTQLLVTGKPKRR